jgi:hypothetical protein
MEGRQPIARSAAGNKPAQMAVPLKEDLGFRSEGR